MRGHEKGHGRWGSRSERKGGTTEIRGKARVAADRIKGIALPGSRTLSEGCRWNGQARAGRHVGVCYRVSARTSPWRLEASWGWVWEIVRKGRVSWNHRGRLIRRSWLAGWQFFRGEESWDTAQKQVKSDGDGEGSPSVRVRGGMGWETEVSVRDWSCRGRFRQGDPGCVDIETW